MLIQCNGLKEAQVIAKAINDGSTKTASVVPDTTAQGYWNVLIK